MSTILLTLPSYRSLHEGQRLTFKAPANSEECTALKIQGTSYDLVDSLGKSVLGVPGFFTSGGILETIIDLNNHTLYLEDTPTLHIEDNTCTSLKVPAGATIDTALCGFKSLSAEVVELVSVPLSITAGTMPTPDYWYSVCYGNGKFVAVSYPSATMAYSTDGITWTQGTMSDSTTWDSVCYGNGRFVAVSYNAILDYSTDGINWTKGTVPITANWTSVCYGGDKFVAVATGTDKMIYSTNGTTWTQGTMPTSTYWNSVCYGNGMFVAIAVDSSTMAYSTDGINWTKGTMPANAKWTYVCYGNGKFVAVAADSNTMAYSTNGTTWTQGTMPTSAKWIPVCYGGGLFVALAYNSSTMAYSTNGINWTQGTMPTTANWASVCYGNDKFVAVAYEGDTMAYIIPPSVNLSLDSVELDSQIIFRSPNSMTQIPINSDTYAIVYSDNTTIDPSDIVGGSLVTLLLDPENKRAYLL